MHQKLFIRYFSTGRVNNLERIMKQGLSLKDVITSLETTGPLHYAEKWDNVGLLVEPPTENQT